MAPPAERAGRQFCRFAALLLLVAVWTAGGVVMAPPAGAHAFLVGADPAEGSRLTAAPSRVTLQLSESVGLRIGHLRVLDGRGHQADTGSASHPSGDSTKIAVALRPGLGDGSYVVSYGLVSADSHPIKGGYAFVVGSGPLTSASGAVADGSGTDPVVGGVFALARLLSYAGLALIGGLVFVASSWPAGRTDGWTRRTIRLGLMSAVFGAVASLLLQGPYVAGDGIREVFSGSLLGATLSTPFGRLLLLRLGVLAVLAVVATKILRDQEGRPETARFRDDNIALLCGLVLVGTVAGAGHAAAGPQSTLALLIYMAHVAAMSAWLGGLAVLAGWLRPGGTVAKSPRALARFSRLATIAVVVLAVSGTYQAWRGVGTVPALWSTTYGRLLCVKVVAVVVVLAVASRSRRFVRGLAHDTEPEPQAGGVLTATRTGAPAPALHRLVRTELAVCVAVLGIVSVLASTAPGRDAYVQPYEGTTAIAGGSAAVSVSPARSGANTVRVTLSAAGGRAVESREVSATLTLPSEGLGPLPVGLSRVGPGSYTAVSILVPRAGLWRLNLRVRTSDFDATITTVEVRVR